VDLVESTLNVEGKHCWSRGVWVGRLLLANRAGNGHDSSQ